MNWGEQVVCMWVAIFCGSVVVAGPVAQALGYGVSGAETEQSVAAARVDDGAIAALRSGWAWPALDAAPLCDPALLQCEPGSIFSQHCTGYTSARTSDAGAGYAVADNFTGVTGPIHSLYFWGVSLTFPWAECAETHHFNVTIYTSLGTRPDYDDVVCQWTGILPHAQVDTGEDWSLSAPYAIWRWDISTLDPSCGPLDPTQEYWIEIVGASSPEDCWFLWIDSEVGDGKAYQLGATPPEKPTDQSLCLGGDPTALGSCCDDSTGACADLVFVAECTGEFARWTPGVDCASLDPACGQATGACCYDDGTCDETLTYGECLYGKTTGPLWLGASSTCDLCCTVMCPPGGVAEGEPHDCPEFVCVGDANCDGWVDLKDINPFVMGLIYPGERCKPANFDLSGDGLVDLRDVNHFAKLLTSGGIPIECPEPVHEDGFNGGCGSDPPVFSEIECGQMVCGESGTLQVDYPNDPDRLFPVRDMDWYETTVIDPTWFTMTVEAEFPVQGWIIHSDDGACPGTVEVTDTAKACELLELYTSLLLPGTYWFVVAPNMWSDVPCGADYSVMVECMSIPYPVPCPPEGVFESEECGENFNGGCESVPPAFDEINCGDTICGTVWADGGTRDVDWFSLTLTAELSNIHITRECAFPSWLTFLTDGAGDYTDPTCTWCFVWMEGCGLKPCSQATYTLENAPAGEYWLLMLIDDGEPIYDGYPCGTIWNTYVFTVECEAL